MGHVVRRILENSEANIHIANERHDVCAFIQCVLLDEVCLGILGRDGISRIHDHVLGQRLQMGVLVRTWTLPIHCLGRGDSTSSIRVGFVLKVLQIFQGFQRKAHFRHLNKVSRFNSVSSSSVDTFFFCWSIELVSVNNLVDQRLPVEKSIYP